MSTRCQIHVEGTGLWIYKHSDGYPEGVLPTLLPFLSFFAKERGMKDTEYLTAQIVREFATAEFWQVVDPEGYYSKSNRKDAGHLWRRTLGWGIGTEGPHGDEEFVYFVRPDCVEVYEPSKNATTESFPAGWSLIETHKFQE